MDLEKGLFGLAGDICPRRHVTGNDGKGQFLTKKSWFFSGFFCDWVLKISFCYDIMYRRISFSLVEKLR